MNDLFNKNIYLSRKLIEQSGINYIENFQKIREHNQKYIDINLKLNKDYFDHIFDELDPKIILDKEQRSAILKDEDYNLIIAGAGSGKTTTMIAKIKYLIDKQNVKENEILAISFANKNASELKQKLNHNFKIDVNVTTFHKLGLDIILKSENKKFKILEDIKKYNFIMKYLKKEIYQNESDLNNLLNFFIFYLGENEEIKNFKSHEDYCSYMKNQLFNTIKNDLEVYNKNIIKNRKHKRETVVGEKLRSKEEVEIANFLYLNSIDYEYEKRYDAFLPNNRPYCPDFTIKQGENIIYLEHFGINENGTSELYNKNGLEKYMKEIHMKKELHRNHGTKLAYTFSKFNDGRSLLEHLKEILLDNQFILKRRNQVTIFNQLFDSSSNPTFIKFYKLVVQFVSNMKLNEYDNNDINYLIKNTTNNRTKLFLKCIRPIYNKYQYYLKKHDCIDFDDMIIMAIKIIGSKKLDFNYKYIIVDEYQDISMERFHLIQLLSDKLGAKITAVGDDWQAIFSFAGSNVDLFSNFKEKFGYRSLTKIVNTYRNSQELIDTASEFIQQDDANIRKMLHSNKHIEKPICVLQYKEQMGKIAENKSLAIMQAINSILNLDTNAKILLLGRYNKDMEELYDTKYFIKTKEKIICSSFPDADIEFYTVHKAKGIESDYVIIINAIDSLYGFPSKVENDELFDLFSYKKEVYEYAEERRLFYVALTRTKNKVFIITSDKRPSQFIIELTKNRHVEFLEQIEKSRDNMSLFTCPKCGGYLKYTFFNDMQQYVYRCCTDKEICNFMTNDLIYKYPITKCPRCVDGYLLLKKVSDKSGKKYIGCTNYKYDGTGCNYHEMK